MFSFVSLWKHFAFPSAINESSCCITSVRAFDVNSVLDFGHSDRCVLVSHCGFNLHFPDDILCGTCFHVYLPSVSLHEVSRTFAHF